MFTSVFNETMGPKMERKIDAGGVQAPSFLTSSEHRSLDAFWSTFGTLWLPNGTRMAPKKRCWVLSVCILLASFSEHRLLDTFWSPFGSLLAIFWLLLVLWYPFARPRVPFSHFWGLLASFDIFVLYSE